MKKPKQISKNDVLRPIGWEDEAGLHVDAGLRRSDLVEKWVVLMAPGFHDFDLGAYVRSGGLAASGDGIDDRGWPSVSILEEFPSLLPGTKFEYAAARDGYPVLVQLPGRSGEVGASLRELLEKKGDRDA